MMINLRRSEVFELEGERKGERKVSSCDRPLKVKINIGK